MYIKSECFFSLSFKTVWLREFNVGNESIRKLIHSNESFCTSLVESAFDETRMSWKEDTDTYVMNWRNCDKGSMMMIGGSQAGGSRVARR